MFYLLAILALGILVIVHEGGHFLVARLCKMRVELFSVGFGPALWRRVRGETTFQIAAVPLGGFVQIAGLNPGEGVDPNDPRAYPNRPVWQRFLTIFAGPGINYLFAALLLIGLNLAVGVEVAGKGAVVLQTMPGKPAATAGVRPGDEILAIDGKPITAVDQVKPTVKASAGKPIHIEVLREGQKRTIEVTPYKDGEDFLIGIVPGSIAERHRVGIWPAIKTGLEEPIELTWMTLQHFAEIGRGKQSLKDSVGGPVEIVRQMARAISTGWIWGIRFVAIISTMLGFFNLLPLPALDGGRLVFLVFEVLTRRPVNQKVEQVVHAVGMVVLLLLIVVLTVKDVRR